MKNHQSVPQATPSGFSFKGFSPVIWDLTDFPKARLRQRVPRSKADLAAAKCRGSNHPGGPKGWGERRFRYGSILICPHGTRPEAEFTVQRSAIYSTVHRTDLRTTPTGLASIFRAPHAVDLPEPVCGLLAAPFDSSRPGAREEPNADSVARQATGVPGHRTGLDTPAGGTSRRAWQNSAGSCRLSSEGSPSRRPS